MIFLAFFFFGPNLVIVILLVSLFADPLAHYFLNCWLKLSVFGQLFFFSGFFSFYIRADLGYLYFLLCFIFANFRFLLCDPMFSFLQPLITYLFLY